MAKKKAKEGTDEIKERIEELSKRLAEPLFPEGPKNEPPKKICRTKKENFLLNKYRSFIINTIMKLSNRDPSRSCYHADNEFNKKRMQKPSDELIMDASTLFKSVIDAMKEGNCHSIAPYLLKEAMDSLTNMTCCSGGLFYSEFFIEKQEMNETLFYIITFNTTKMDWIY